MKGRRGEGVKVRVGDFPLDIEVEGRFVFLFVLSVGTHKNMHGPHEMQYWLIP